MKKQILALTLIALLSVVVVGCGSDNNQQGNTQQTTQNNQEPNNQQQNNAPNNPITTPAPRGNQAPARLAEEPAEMFTFQFMTVEQLYSEFERDRGNWELFRAGVEFDQSGIVITAYHGELSQVRIPDTIEGFPVVAIDKDAFPLAIVQNGGVTVMPFTDVFFPPTVRVFEFGVIKVIGQVPQNTPNNLPNSITVPHGVTHFVYQNRSGVNRDVFAAIRSIELPNTLVDIPRQMFEGLTSLTGITIPNSVERIGESAFEGATSLLRIDFPDNITNVAHNAFDGTSWLNAQPDGVVYVGNVAVTWNGESPSDGRLTIREGTTVITDRAFRQGTNSSQRLWQFRITDVIIPNSVTHIGEWAFYGSSMTSLALGNGVTHIGEWAFAQSRLTSVTIPDSVTHIGTYAFGFSQLTSVTIGNNVTHMNDSAFAYSQLTSVTIGNGVTHIGNWAFSGNQLTSVTIPDSVTNIGWGAFWGNQLTSVTIPESVTRIDDDAFANNQLTNVTIPDSVTHIGHYAFSDNPLNETTIERIRAIFPHALW